MHQAINRDRNKFTLLWESMVYLKELGKGTVYEVCECIFVRS